MKISSSEYTEITQRNISFKIGIPFNSDIPSSSQQSIACTI